MSILTALYSERNAQAVQPAIPTFIPTLFIGLGGSGKSVLMRLRKQFHDRFAGWGSRFDRFARFVFIDTDRASFVPRGQADALFADVFPRESEVVEGMITRADFQRIFDNLERRVESDHLHWLKPSMRTVGPGAVEDGAGTHRQFGRLAFFVNYTAIRQQIQAQIEEVLAYATQHAGEVAANRIEVVIVTSLAGGTGSGMFLDVAYLVRDLLDHPDYAGLQIKHVTIVAFLPEVFRDNQSLLPRLRQNAYAALLELEHYGTPRTGDALFLGDTVAAGHNGRDGRHGFRATWPGQEKLFVDRGWDTLFLVDNVNNLTRADPMNADEVFQMTADYLFLDFGQSQFASEKRTARSNLVQYKDRWKGTWVRRVADPAAPRGIAQGAENVFATQSGCIYSTFGLSEIFFDLDNLYQAAGYRLASRLVRSRWLGSAQAHSDQVHAEWTARDLFYPQPAPGQAFPPPSFHPDAVAKRAVTSKDRNWLMILEEDFRRIEEHGDDEAAGMLGPVVAKHRAGLDPRGEARATIAENVARWIGTPTILGAWRERLRELANQHLSEHGAKTTSRLLSEYRVALDAARLKLTEAERADLSPALLSRLEEAKMVPFPVRRIAVGIELKRARDAAKTELHKHYAATAKAVSDLAYASATRYLGEPGRRVVDGAATTAHGTLQETIEKVSEQLERIADRLESRFLVAAQGRDLVNRRKQSLNVIWDQERYDRKINQALVLHDPVGRDPQKPEGAAPADDPFEFDWVHLEQFVRDELRRVDKDGPSGSLAELVRFWETNRMVNQENVEEIAQRLAEACEAVLRRAGLRLADVEHGNVADLLINVTPDNRRDQMIEQMVIAAAPYLPTTPRPADGIQPANHNLFGLSVGGQPTSRRNADAVSEAVAAAAAMRQAGGVASFGQRLEAEQSSALFVRMVAGFPLQDYTRLEELYRSYKDPATNTRSNDECHIDYKQSWEDLPDIRAVGPDTYAQVRENVDVVLLNMMVGAITYPRDKAAFYVLIPDPYGAGEDFHRLGKRISRAVKHACDDEAVRKYLADRWDEWSRRATVKGWACLYESALRTWNESRREVEVEAGRTEPVPFRNCYGGLLRMIGKKLGEVEGGRPWLDALKPTSAAGDDGDGRLRVRPRPIGLDAALKPIHEGLKIYQIVASKVESVTLPQDEVIAPPA